MKITKSFTACSQTVLSTYCMPFSNDWIWALAVCIITIIIMIIMIVVIIVETEWFIPQQVSERCWVYRRLTSDWQLTVSRVRGPSAQRHWCCPSSRRRDRRRNSQRHLAPYNTSRHINCTNLPNDTNISSVLQLSGEEDISVIIAINE